MAYIKSQSLGTYDSLFRGSNLDLDILHILENDLEIYEKVSLVFLLYDDVHMARQGLALTLKALERSHSSEATNMNLIHSWACDYGKYWKEKLVEALLIIQAFSNISKLGLQLEILNNHFSPKCSETSVFIHPVKKMLYKISESLTITSTKELVEMILKDGKCHAINTDKNDFKFLELFLLKLLETKYMSIGSWKPSILGDETKEKIPSEMGNLVSVLKRLRLGAHWINLNDSEKFVNSELKIVEIQLKTISIKDAIGDKFACSIPDIKRNNSPGPTTDMLEPEKNYKIEDSENMGIVMIINQITFENSNSLSDTLDDRDGSNVDKNRLIEVWQMYGFTTIVFENLTHKEIILKTKQVINNDTKLSHSAFVLCILSHGEEGTVFGSDSIPVDVRTIQKLFYRCVNLIGKPKIFIIQACQGKQNMNIVTTPPVSSFSTLRTDGMSLSVPERSDIFSYWATGPECVSYRDTIEGSWFIQTFCEILEKHGDKKKFLDICTMVNDIISNKRYEGSTQMSEYTSCCRKDLYLKKKKNS